LEGPMNDSTLMHDTQAGSDARIEIPPVAEIVEPPPSSERLGVAEAVSCAPRRALAGRRLVSPGHSEIYVVDPDGFRRRIPNHTTYNRLFRNWSGIDDEPNLHEIAIGPELTTGTILVRGDAADAIYLLDQGRKRLVADAAAMDKYWFNWSRIFAVRQAVIDRIPPGADWE
ncbi:MAG TPA: hypothetical protein VGY54_26955, partial [Polyangiaceae bacterium]|nr:hypothetical protein [Polyangiaceae bacterium]